jgi:outer membrane protein insertion porin family
MKISLKPFFLLSAWLFAAIVTAQPGGNFDYGKGGEYEIADIRVEGARNLDGRILITLSGLAKGDKIKVPGEEIPKAIKTLWKQKLFTNVSIEAERITSDKIYLVIKVEERPRISRYSLRGIKNSESEELRKKLDLRAGQIFTENMRSMTINTCKNYFIDKGFLSVEVTV